MIDAPEKDYTPTAEQARWWKRLNRVIKEMPEGVELLVSDGNIALTHAGETDAYFNVHGHVDNVETMLVESIQSPGIKDVMSKL